jgi:hypothetical protein
MGETDSHKNADVRAILAPMAALAAKHQVAILAVSHLGKSENSALYRVIGSIAFVAAARAVHLVARDKADIDRRIFAPLKNNLAPKAPALAFRVDAAPSVVWEPGTIEVDAAELLGRDYEPRKRGPRPNRLEAALALVTDLLADGEEHAARDLEELANANGISPARLKESRKQLGVLTRKDDFNGGWLISLPKSPSFSTFGNSDSSDTSIKPEVAKGLNGPDPTKSLNFGNRGNSDSSTRQRFKL